MNPTLAVSPQNSLHVLYEPIAAELADVEHVLRQELRSDYPYVDEMVQYGCLLGGKRLRPALLLLCGRATGTLTREHILLAAVVEMIHTATLVHDDVLDEAMMRRHLATVNARWDNEASILLGDYLFTHAFYLASTLDSTVACRLIGRATNIVCEGEIRQKGSRGCFGLSESEYVSIVAAKTAELVACSCQLGAAFSGADETTTCRLAEYGRDLGIAFQIADDLLDILGEESATGKSLGTDLDQQKPTLPLIRTWQCCDTVQRQELESILHGDPALRYSALQPYLDACDAVAYTRHRAQTFARRAREQLDALPPSPALSVLEMLTDFVVARVH